MTELYIIAGVIGYLLIGAVLGGLVLRLGKEEWADEARCKDPRFHNTYREALIALKKVLEDRVNNDVKRMVEIEYEIAKI